MSLRKQGFNAVFKKVESRDMKEKLVYQRKDGRWEARYKKGVSPEGRTLYGAVYGSTKEEVLKRRSLITGAPNAAEISSPTEMNLLILGAGTHGRDVYEIAESLHLFQKIRFLDDQAEGANIIGKCRDAVQFRKEYPCALIAIGDNRIRRKYAKLLQDCGFLTPSIVSPEASVSNKSKIGKGTVILAQARTGEAEIGEYCILASNSLVNSGAKVGAFSHLDCGSMVLKGASVPDGMMVKSGEIYPIG